MDASVTPIPAFALYSSISLKSTKGESLGSKHAMSSFLHHLPKCERSGLLSQHLSGKDISYILLPRGRSFLPRPQNIDTNLAGLINVPFTFHGQESYPLPPHWSSSAPRNFFHSKHPQSLHTSFPPTLEEGTGRNTTLRLTNSLTHWKLTLSSLSTPCLPPLHITNIPGKFFPDSALYCSHLAPLGWPWPRFLSLLQQH